MCGLAKLGFEPAVPPLGKALSEVFDLAMIKLGFAVQKTAAVDDMSGLRGEVFELVCELGFSVRPTTPDCLKHSCPMARSGAHHLLLFGGIQALHRASDPAPSILKYLSGDGTNRIIQLHGQTPSKRLSRPTASHHDGGAQAGQSRLHYQG
jgi:hypothetical protein